MMLQSICDYLVKTYINIANSSNSDTTISLLLKMIANDNSDESNRGSFIRTYVIIVFAVGFSLIIICAKYVFSNLFLIRSKVKDSFYETNKQGNIIEIDYLAWTSSNKKIFRGFIKLAYMSI